MLYPLVRLFGAFIVGTAAAFASSSYYQQSAFLLAPPAVFHPGDGWFLNPANLGLLPAPELQFRWSPEARRLWGLDAWEAHAALPHAGFGMQERTIAGIRTTDYRLALGFGSPAHATGLAYSWSRGPASGGERTLIAANIWRPLAQLSVGVTGHFGLKQGTQEWVGEIGVRPLGTPRLTCFGDLAWRERGRLDRAPWSLGLAVALAPGIDLSARRFDTEAFTVGLRIDFGRSSVAAQTHFDAERDFASSSYGVRAGGRQASLFPGLVERDRRYLAMELKGRVDYLRYVLLDDGTLRLYDLLSDIEAAAADPRIGVIAVNLSALQIAPEHAWELREELRKARASGKVVIAFVGQAGMTAYHLASVADRVVMDPEGMLLLEGYALSRTYLAGTLAKLGLGFDEWRFFKYKSAAETFSRDRMSEADREQYQAYVDDWYELTRAEISRSRSLDERVFDSLIDQRSVFSARGAREAGLVDTLARWSDAGAVVHAIAGRSVRKLPAGDLRSRWAAHERWGRPPRIALVYGLGVCALDEGIRARWLERLLDRLRQDPAVKAVVFRVDSPGGDGMASDLVAQALRRLAQRKPVIVSQGQVAGSGGYWVSLYGDTIVAGPNTVTGSIGVIGGWIYDDGFGAKLGMTSDHVQRGRHADLSTGIRLPLLGATVPARNLTGEEREIVEQLVHELYERFLQQVSAARGLPVDSVRRIAEGHFYSGVAGRRVGLVDEIGGLLRALEIARMAAGLAATAAVEIEEYPKNRGLVKLPRSRLGVGTDGEDPVLEYIRHLASARGRFLPLLPPGTYPTASD